jgi:phenylacetate-CoA ligase
MHGQAPEDTMSRHDLAHHQARRLTALLQEILPRNQFYARKLGAAGVTPGSFDLAQIPFTTKEELLACQADDPPYGDLLTYPLDRYIRFHQTSGTSGMPLRWLDTRESWTWALDCWTSLYRIAGVEPGDRLFFPFSFGPFLGFWTGFEAGSRMGCLCLPGGGMSSTARLRFLFDNHATVVLCTPTYALRLAEVAQEKGIDLSASPVRAVIVAGEPGGSIPGTRDRIEAAWGARVYDHNGMTEIGPTGIECTAQPGGLHVLETEYLAEVVDPATGQHVPNGVPGELVLTNFGRWGSPLLRYRTGDLVCVDPRPCPCGRALMRLDGGIRGRVDDMIVVRGNNLHPSMLQAILHQFPEVAEYRVQVDRSSALAVLRIELEPRDPARGRDLVARVAQAIQDELLFRAEVRAVAPGSLPRFDLKSRRVV